MYESEHAPRPAEIERLNRLERDLLLDFLLYRMDTTLRRRFMHAHPVLYNRLYRTDVMVVRHREDVAPSTVAAERRAALDDLLVVAAE